MAKKEALAKADGSVIHFGSGAAIMALARPSPWSDISLEIGFGSSPKK
jgi:hypothetical protein